VNDVLRYEYAYDGNGVRTDLREWDDTPTLIREELAEADGRDRILTYDGIVYVHDVDGTRVWERDPDGGIGATHGVRCYTYDITGALLEVEDGFVDEAATGHPCEHGSFTTAGSVTYAIDPMGRRASRTEDASTIHWIYMDELNPVAQLDSDGALVQRYLYATSGAVPDALITYDPSTGDELARYRYITDARGSVVQVVRVDTGAVVQAITYGPWGEVLSDTNPGFQPFGYAGGHYDRATELVRFGERDYDPRTGRWTARDPIGFAGGDTNLYAYVGGDPINFVDPTGLSPGTYVCVRPVQGPIGFAYYHTYYWANGRSWATGFGEPSEDYDDESQRFREPTGPNIPSSTCLFFHDIDGDCMTKYGETYGRPYFPLVHDCRDMVMQGVRRCRGNRRVPESWGTMRNRVHARGSLCTGPRASLHPDCPITPPPAPFDRLVMNHARNFMLGFR